MSGLRQEIADELDRHSPLWGPHDPQGPVTWFSWCECGWDCGVLTVGAIRQYRTHVADALLPIIERVTAEAAAEALEAAAVWQDREAARVWPRAGTHRGGAECAAVDLRYRAAQLRAAVSTDEGGGR